MAAGSLARGVNNPIMRNGPETYDFDKAGPSCVVKVGPGDYRQWYEGLDTANGPSGEKKTLACYATSQDGHTWTKYASNPIVDGLEAWEDDEVSPVSVLYDPDAALWKMWYHGGNNTGGRAIGYATSSDGLSWSKYAGNPILTPVETWETDGGSNTGLADFKVIRRGVGDYHGWYRNAVTGKFGYATSADGIAWTKYAGNPVFEESAPAAWDEYLMAFCPVWDGIWRAWYCARESDFSSSGIGYATSPDGITWTKSGANPILVDLAVDSPQDSIHAYWDNGRVRIVYGQYYLGDTPALRGKGQAFEVLSARNLNGTSDYVELARESDFDFTHNSTYSVGLWYYPAAVSYGALVSKQTSLGNFQGWQLYGDANGSVQRFAMDMRPAAGNGWEVRTSNSFATQTWWSVLGTYSGNGLASGVNIYVNGVDEGLTTANDVLASQSALTDAPVRVGARGSDGAGAFHKAGRAAYVAIWNVELSAADALQFYKGGVVPRQDALVAFLRLDNGESPETDETGGNNGTLTGTTVVDGPPVMYDALYRRPYVPRRMPAGV